MDWGDPPVVAALIGAGVALLAAAGSIWQAWEARRARKEAEGARDEARSAASMERIAEAIEKIASAKEDLSWWIEWLDEITFRLHNETGQAFAGFKVVIPRLDESEAELEAVAGQSLSVGPGSSVDVEFFTPSLADPQDPTHVLVRPREAEVDFEVELPPRPSRRSRPGNFRGIKR